MALITDSISPCFGAWGLVLAFGGAGAGDIARGLGAFWGRLVGLCVRDRAGIAEQAPGTLGNAGGLLCVLLLPIIDYIYQLFPPAFFPPPPYNPPSPALSGLVCVLEAARAARLQGSGAERKESPGAVSAAPGHKKSRGIYPRLNLYCL